MVFKAIVVLAVAVAVWFMLGCGGGDSSLSKAEYDQKLELTCNKGLQEREEFLGEVDKKYEEQGPHQNAKEKAEEQAKNIKGLMAVYQGTTEEIADIGLPEKEEEKAEELVEAREAAVTKVEADPAGSISNITAIFEKPNKVAEGLEVGSCAK